MAPVRRPTRAAAAASYNKRGSATSGKKINAINKTKPSLPKKVKTGNESCSLKAPKKVSQNSPTQKILSKRGSYPKPHCKVAVKSPTKTSSNQKENPVKVIQRPPSARIVSKKKGLLKLTTTKEEAVKPVPRKNVTKTTISSGRSLSQSRSTKDSLVGRRESKASALKTASQSLKPPLVLASDKPAAQKRVLSSPARSPTNAKSRRLYESMQKKKALDQQDDCINLDEGTVNTRQEPKSSSEKVKSGVPLSADADSGSKSPDSELSGKCRRKWFSLKTRGGFTCLRSAILSPEEVANVVLQHTLVESSKQQDINFFTTKLMMHLSSRLPPTKLQPSCEESVPLNESKKTTVSPQSSKESKGDGTAIRLKTEKRSLSNTINVDQKTMKPIVSPRNPSRLTKPSGKLNAVTTRQADSALSKKQEREIALQQLKNL